MQMIDVKIFSSSENNLPAYARTGDAGMDICASEDVTIYPSTLPVPVTTGIYVKIPEGYEIQVRPRSGMSAKTKLRVANSPGTIDSGYTGEIKVLLENNGHLPTEVKKGDRIAQLVLKEVPQINWKPVTAWEELESTERGTNGFGSTGV